MGVKKKEMRKLVKPEDMLGLKEKTKDNIKKPLYPTAYLVAKFKITGRMKGSDLESYCFQ